MLVMLACQAGPTVHSRVVGRRHVQPGILRLRFDGRAAGNVHFNI